MKKLNEYISEAEQWMEEPSTGDYFDIELEDDTLLETYVMETNDDKIILDSNDTIYSLLESWNMLEDEELNEFSPVGTIAGGIIGATVGGPVGAVRGAIAGNSIGNTLSDDHDMEQSDEKDPGEYDQEGDMAKTELHTIIRSARKLVGMLDDNENMPEWTQSKISKAADYVDTVADYIESNKERGIDEQDIDEAEYQGREVALNKPTRGDVKKFKVYVKDPKTGNVKKVNFGHGGTSAKRAGQKTMKIKKSDPARRKSFRARHNCDNPGPKTKARYWSCRAW